MSVLNQSGEEQVECPLCMEPLEVDDLNFYPCTCGYQICRFCWHRIRTDENGLCPACRKAYSENPADFTPLSKEQVAQLKAEKRQRDQQRKAKLSESRKHLASVRVVQKNLVFVVGLPVRLADADVLKRHEYFGKFGKIHKVVINQSTSYAGSQGPSASAYVTYVKSDDALRAIQNVNNIMLDGRLIKSSLGTTKYCSHFMKNQPCPKADCMYLHDFGDPEASFTKEQMHMGKHQEYEKKLHEALLNRTAVQQQLQQQQQTPATGCEKTPPSTQSNGTAVPESKTKQNGGGQKDANWPTLSTSSSSSSSENSNSSSTSSGFSNKTEKQQKSESKSEKSQKKSNNQKNKNNNNTSSTNNNIENSKKSEKSTTTKSNCEQTNCQQQQQSQQNQQQQQLQQQPAPTSIALEKPPIISTKDTPVTPLSVTTPTMDNNTSSTTSDCLESLAKIQLLDDNSSFFSHNSFQKLLPAEHDSSSYSTDSSSLTPHSNILTDNLLDINSSEDWQAAFGFANVNSTKHHQPETSPVLAGSHTPTDSILSNSSGSQSQRNATVANENGLGGFGNAPSDFGGLNRTENGYKLDQSYSGLNHLENYQKSQQNHSYDVLKPRDSILDVLAGRTTAHYNGVVPSYKHLDATSDRHNHTSPYIGLNQSSKPLENGLDQMSKFFAEFNKSSQKDIVYNGFSHQSNGFVPTIGDRQGYLGGGNQVNLSENQHNLLILNQYQQRLVDKHLEEQQALYNLKQNVFHSQQQQQQYLHNHNTQQPQQASHQQHHTGTQQQQQQYLTNGGDHFLGQNGQSFGTSGYSQSSVFQNQTLQQRNQVQIRDRSSVDDDLGFDPFHETQKALAELIESEQGVSQIQNSGHSTNGASTGPVNGLIHGGGVSSNSAPGSCLPPPPPGFMQHTTHMNSFGSKILPFLNMSNSQQISSSGGWSTNYSEAQLKGLAPVNDWMTLDPAIVSSSRHFPLASLQPLRDQYGSFQQQSQQQQQQTGPTLRGYDYQSPQQQQQQQQSQPPQTNGYTNNTYVSQQQQQQQQSYNTNSYTAQHLASQQQQPNGLSWYGTDLHAQISSPPGFRQATPATAPQSKSQEC